MNFVEFQKSIIEGLIDFLMQLCLNVVFVFIILFLLPFRPMFNFS